MIHIFCLQVGSEDALSSVDDLNVTEQLSMKAHSLEQVSTLFLHLLFLASKKHKQFLKSFLEKYCMCKYII